MTLLLINLALFVTGTAGDIPNAVQDAQILAKIVQDWKDRQKNVTGFRVSMSEEVFHPDDSLDGTTGGKYVDRMRKGTTTRGTLSLSVDYQQNRIRRVTDSQFYNRTLSTVMDRYQVETFDGLEYRDFHPREKNRAFQERYNSVEMGKSRSYPRDLLFRPMDYPLAFAVGVIPLSQGDFDAKRAWRLKVPEKFTVRGKAVIDGKECVIIRSKAPAPGRFADLCVDTANRSAILRAEYYWNDVMSFRLEINYADTAKPALPTDWKFDWYNSGAGMTTQRILQYELNPAFLTGEFREPFKPGILVRDSDRSKQYRVADDGQTLIEVPRDTGKTTSFGLDLDLMLLVVSVVVLIVVFGVYYVQQRRRVAAGAP